MLQLAESQVISEIFTVILSIIGSGIQTTNL
jgi:hypothetical protein